MHLRALSAAAIVLSLSACAKDQNGPAGPGEPGRACTEIGCMNGLRIELKKAGAWAPGAYTFAFTLDGAAVNCSGALPLKPCEAGPSLTCDVADRVAIGESGCALPADGHGFADVQVTGEPKEVKLTISRDGQAVASAELRPTYTESRPNGPGCEPVCRNAAETIQVP